MLAPEPPRGWDAQNLTAQRGCCCFGNSIDFKISIFFLINSLQNNNGQLIEINAVITTFIMVGRVGDALGVSDPVLFSKSVAKSVADIQSMNEPALVAYANALGIDATVNDLKKDTLAKVMGHLNLN